MDAVLVWRLNAILRIVRRILRIFTLNETWPSASEVTAYGERPVPTSICRAKQTAGVGPIATAAAPHVAVLAGPVNLAPQFISGESCNQQAN